VAVVIIVAAFGFLLYGGIDKNVVFFLTPEELLARGTSAYDVPVRLGGLVQPGSVKWDAEKLDLRFVVADSGGQSVNVHSTGAPPQMFRDGMGVVVEGRYHRSGSSSRPTSWSSTPMNTGSGARRPAAGDVQIAAKEPARDATAGSVAAAALGVAIYGALACFWRAKTADLLRSGELAVYVMWGWFGRHAAMVYALVSHDFSVKYVAMVGSRATPLFYTVISLWGALEGSILFWIFVLASLSALVTYQNRNRETLVPYAGAC
jgi:cytochrome c-type biogenesis protein CcmE